jgi:O-antigen ligase
MLHRTLAVNIRSNVRRKLCSACVIGAVIAYVIAMQTFVSRNPIGMDAGPQGIIQLTLIGCSGVLAVVALIASRRRFRMRGSVMLFASHGLFAAVWSINSFWPLLSIVKACLFFTTVVVAISLARTAKLDEILRVIYWTSFLVLIAGIALSFMYPQDFPLFSESGTSEYNWRARLQILRNHPVNTADMCGLAVLIGLAVRPRPPVAVQVFFLLANAAAMSRASSGALVLIGSGLAAGLIFRSRSSTARVAAVISIGILCTVLFLAFNPQLLQVSNDTERGLRATLQDRNLNNRLPLWNTVLQLRSGAELFGFGFDGARQILIERFSWAGHAHNAFLEDYLSDGVLGLFPFILGWIGIVHAGWKGQESRRWLVLAIQLYLGVMSLFGPVLASATGLPLFVFLILGCGSWQSEGQGKRSLSGAHQFRKLRIWSDIRYLETARGA